MDLALCLETTEFGAGAVQDAMRLGAGPVDRLLNGRGGGISHGIELEITFGIDYVRFDYGTAAEAPGGVDDLGCERLFERTFGRKLLLKVFAEEMVEAIVFREYEAGGGIDAEGDGVAGGAGFAFFGARPGGGFGVAAVGGGLSFGCHGWSFSS